MTVVRKQHLQALALVVIAALASTGATCNKQLTQENSPEGKIAVYGTKVSDGVRAISTAVRGLESAGSLPTDQAAKVVKITAAIQGHLETLANMLATYDALAPDAAARVTLMEKIQATLDTIGALSTSVLVPIGQESAREQLSTLVGQVNEAIVTLNVELAKGVR